MTIPVRIPAQTTASLSRTVLTASFLRLALNVVTARMVSHPTIQFKIPVIHSKLHYNLLKTGTKDLDLSSPGRYCIEIDGCRDEQCYDVQPNPASCVDVPYTDLDPADAENLVTSQLKAFITRLFHSNFVIFMLCKAPAITCFRLYVPALLV